MHFFGQTILIYRDQCHQSTPVFMVNPSQKMNCIQRECLSVHVKLCPFSSRHPDQLIRMRAASERKADKIDENDNVILQTMVALRWLHR